MARRARENSDGRRLLGLRESKYAADRDQDQRTQADLENAARAADSDISRS